MKPARWAAIAVALSAAAPAQADSLVKRLLRIAGLTASPSQMKGDEEVTDGTLWIADLRRGTTSELTRSGAYRWPVFVPATGEVLALRGGEVVRIASDGAAVPVAKLSHATKLVGFDTQAPDLVLVVLDEGRSPLGLFSVASRKTTLLPYDRKSTADRRLLEHVRGQERVYGDTSVYVKLERAEELTGGAQWTDVYVKTPDAPPRNVSNCRGANCSQPSLSPDGTRVVFVKEER
jgi:hypothetical protein